MDNTDLQDIELILVGHAIGLKPKGIRRRMVNGKNYSNRAVSGLLSVLICRGVVKKYTRLSNPDNIRYMLVEQPKNTSFFNINIPTLRRNNR